MHLCRLKENQTFFALPWLKTDELVQGLQLGLQRQKKNNEKSFVQKAGRHELLPELDWQFQRLSALKAAEP